MELSDFKTRLLKYTTALTLLVIAAQVAVYWRTGFDNWTMYATLAFAWFLIATIGLLHLQLLISTHTAAMAGLLVISLLIATTPLLHPADVLHPNWYLVLVLFSYIFFSRKLSLIIMLCLYLYFLVYTLVLIPNSYNLDEITTLTASLFVTGALCSAASRESSYAYQKLAVAANTDPMTKLWNRRGVEKLFKELVAMNFDREATYSIAVVDLDHFKSINDKLGHSTGDEVICLAADLIKSTSRQTDIAARLGGEEFLLILPEDTGGTIKLIIERIRQRYQSEVQKIVTHELSETATLSAGVLHNIPSNITILEALRLGDRLMYQAKEKGRNAVVAASYEDTLIRTSETRSTQHIDKNQVSTSA